MAICNYLCLVTILYLLFLTMLARHAGHAGHDGYDSQADGQLDRVQEANRHETGEDLQTQVLFERSRSKIVRDA